MNRDRMRKAAGLGLIGVVGYFTGYWLPLEVGTGLADGLIGLF